VTPPSDAALVASVLAGDVEAYGLLVARHRGKLFRFALHMLGNREDAEEALQDAFVRGYRALAQCKDPSRVDGWLFRILANRCRTRGARRTRYERTFVLDESALLSARSDHPAEREAWRAEIRHALARLDPASREAFLMKHVEELSYEEMAEATGAGISALKMRVKRACERLRGLLGEVDHVRV
jgi:RNA polymerase sigma-70 factor (ECF subfamily)